MKLGIHRNSKTKVAVKIIDKQLIWQTFLKEGHPFEEVKLMEDVCKGQLPHLLDLYETYETPQSYILVTKFMPGGSLGQYLHDRLFEPMSEVRTK